MSNQGRMFAKNNEVATNSTTNTKNLKESNEYGIYSKSALLKDLYFQTQ